MYELHCYPTKQYNRSDEYRRRFRHCADAMFEAQDLLERGDCKVKLYRLEKMRWGRWRKRLIFTATCPDEVPVGR